MNRTIRTHTTSTTINEIIPLPNENLIPQKEAQYEIHLEDVSLDSVHELINKAEDIEEVEPVNWTYMMAIPSWPTLLLYTFVISAISWRIYSFKKHTAVASREDAPGSSRTSFHLKEGGVTMP
uniref:Uncharacterized protein n=5 Tax=Pararge aegeria TaxID=116150 RepID=S4PEF1_9NEOP